MTILKQIDVSIVNGKDQILQEKIQFHKHKGKCKKWIKNLERFKALPTITVQTLNDTFPVKLFEKKTARGLQGFKGFIKHRQFTGIANIIQGDPDRYPMTWGFTFSVKLRKVNHG